MTRLELTLFVTGGIIGSIHGLAGFAVLGSLMVGGLLLSLRAATGEQK